MAFSSLNFFHFKDELNKKALQDVSFSDEATLKEKSIVTKYPNIFYIIPDGLASPRILKNYADVDHEVSIGTLRKKGFSVLEHAYSSYNLTGLSLSALFQMTSPVTEMSENYKNTSTFYPSIREKKPALLRYLKLNNYEFVIVPPSWGGCPMDPEYTCLTPLNYNGVLNDYAIRTLVEPSLMYHVANKLLPNLFGYSDMDDAGNTAIEHMKRNQRDWADGGVFTMIHMFIPHAPYRNADCSRISSVNKILEIASYKTSVFCAFKRIGELSDFIIKNFPDATIVVQGDHGITVDESEWDRAFVELSPSFIDSRMGIYSAVRGCNSNQAVKLHQANIIRDIVQCLTGQAISKEYDNKSYFGFYSDNNPDFGLVFSVEPH